jgi:hypothetical protein
MYAHIFLFCFILGNHFYLCSKVSFPMLMVGGVNVLLEPPNAADNLQVILQVTGIISGTSKAGHHRVTVTFIDANHFMDCHSSPKLFHLFDEDVLTMLDVVAVDKVAPSR